MKQDLAADYFEDAKNTLQISTASRNYGGVFSVMPPHGPPGSATVVKTMTGYMHRDEHHHQHTDNGEEDLESQRNWCRLVKLLRYALIRT